jgi:hypothetical protein
VADVPDYIVLRRHRDLAGRAWYPWVRRALTVLILAVPVLGLLNLFGQRPSTATAVAPDASMKVYSPTSVRGGLLFEARFHVTARRDLKDAILVLGSGWLVGMTVNTIEPSPVNEASRSGRLALELGHIPAGQSYVLYVQFQVNPTNVGHRLQTVELDDGDRQILSLRRSITIYP